MINNDKKYFIRSLQVCYLLLFFIAFISSSAAFAAVDSWSLNSPPGGVVQSVAVDPNAANTLYIGTASNGVYKSTDAGITWTHASNGISFLDIQVIAVDPNNSNQVLAGTNGGGVFRSTDAGANWEAINTGIVDSNTGLINLNVYSIVFDPFNPNMMYLGTFGNVFSSDKRTNNSVIWYRRGADTGLRQNAIQALVAAPVAGAYFAGAYLGGTYSSATSTVSWAISGLNGGNNSPHVDVRSLLIDSSGRLLAGTQEEGIYIGTITYPGVGAHPTVVWAASSAGLSTNATVNSIVESSTALYAGTHNNVYRSIDNGANWTAISADLSGVHVHSLAIDLNSTTETIYAGTPQGVYKLADNSSSWTLVNNGINAIAVTDHIIDNNAPTTHYVTTKGSGVLRTTDAGTSWQFLNNGLADLHILSMTMDGSNLYVGTEQEGTYKSTDNGASWVSMNNGIGSVFISHLADDEATSDILYAGTLYGLNNTTDGAANWSTINGDIKLNHDVKIQSLTLDHPATTNRRIYISTASSGIFYSALTNIAWTNTSLVGLDNTFVYDIAIDPNNANTLYAATRGSGVYKSIDRGASWFEINTGLRPTSSDIVHVNTLAIDPSDTNIIYAGTETRGVFRSTNGGSSWSQLNTGLDTLNINTLRVHPTTGRVFAGTNGSGLLEADFTIASNTSAPQTANPAKINANNNDGGSGNTDVLLLLLLMLMLSTAYRTRSLFK